MSTSCTPALDALSYGVLSLIAAANSLLTYMSAEAASDA